MTQDKKLVDMVVEGLQDGKASKIVVVNLTEIENCICQYMVICEGNSSTQVRALADEVEYKLGQSSLEKDSADRDVEHQWIVLDYGCVMIHIFYQQTRDFYNLEKLWADAEEIDVSDIVYDK